LVNVSIARPCAPRIGARWPVLRAVTGERQLMHVEIRKFEYSLRNFARSTVFCETMFRASCSVLGAKSSCSQVPCSEWGVKSSCSQVPCSVLGAKSSCSELHVQAWGSKVHVPSFMFHVPTHKENPIAVILRHMRTFLTLLSFLTLSCAHSSFIMAAPVGFSKERALVRAFFSYSFIEHCTLAVDLKIGRGNSTIPLTSTFVIPKHGVQ